jgi:hypothetical protein
MMALPTRDIGGADFWRSRFLGIFLKREAAIAGGLSFDAVGGNWSPATYAVGLASIGGQHFFFTNFF